MFRNKFKFSKKPLALTQSFDIIPAMDSQPQHRVIDLLPSNAVHLASALTGKTVAYTNKNDSSVTTDRERVFKIQSVEDISISEATGNRYITAKVQDLDDGGTAKYRNLIVDGISIVV